MDQILHDFLELTGFSAPSRKEGTIRKTLAQKLRALGFETHLDNAFPETGSGNLYGFLPGEGDPILFSAHMDTVTPCDNKRITVEPDGRIHTDGTTILGGDDVTGIVELLEAVRLLQREGLPHRPIEFLFSACEEDFVEGVRHLDYTRLRSGQAYILDTDGEIGRAVLAAPTGIRVTANFTGKAAHAALEPETGINALVMAAEAVSAMRLGRIDEETTANIGILQGGVSGNIVPESCFVEGETRSLSHEKALRQRDHMTACLQKAAKRAGGRCDVRTRIVYEAWETPADAPLCLLFAEAAKQAGLSPKFERACGGSDASVLSAHGLQCLILATGMHEIHSVREYTTLGEMKTMSQVVKNLMRRR